MTRFTSILIANRDWRNWAEKDISPMTTPRPGHADLTGVAILRENRALRHRVEIHVGENEHRGVAAELEDDQFGGKVVEGRPDAFGAALGRLAADTGVHDPMFVPLLFESGLQQCGPGLAQEGNHGRPRQPACRRR